MDGDWVGFSVFRWTNSPGCRFGKGGWPMGGVSFQDGEERNRVLGPSTKTTRMTKKYQKCPLVSTGTIVGVGLVRIDPFGFSILGSDHGGHLSRLLPWHPWRI